MMKGLRLTAVLALGLATTGTSAFATPASKLLLTELIDTPTAEEMVEIVNPGGSTVTLNSGITLGADNGTLAGAYFINDSGLNYWQVVNGLVTGGGSGDGIYYFPSGATLAAGQVTCVVGDGNAFLTDPAVQVYLLGSSGNTAAAAYAAYTAQPGSPTMFETAGTSVLVPDMLIATTTAGVLSFTNTGEAAMLYYWDGQSDKIVDIDGVVTDAAGAGSNQLIVKTGVSIDGPDAGAGTSTYGTDGAQANFIATGNIFRRTTASEGQTGATANGIGGTDEFSESWSSTWATTTTTTALTPGDAPAGVPVEVSKFTVD